jgi:hypothetical protein
MTTKPKNNSFLLQVISLVITVLALAMIALTMVFFLQKASAPLAPATAPASTPSAPTSEGVGYPAPTIEPTATATLEPDVSLTLAWIQTSQPIATVDYPVGIFEEGLANYSKLGFAIQNGWRREINGYAARVAAGALVSDPQQGIVLVSWDLPDAPNAGVYETPLKAGAVRITAEDGFRLTLQANDGTIFYFDVPGQKFVSSLTEIAPTVTPRPSFTPEMPTQPVPTGYPPILPTAQATMSP